ncbi:MAG TPA: polymer-forming cytoskeletal protein [Pyrinomonadaceae bacterium]|nr:polymer-forming cytoskeletal protein [Pyrinomonadaceae bacterium]
MNTAADNNQIELGDEVAAPELSITRGSLVADSARAKFADLPPDMTSFFESWLDSLRPSSKPIDNPAPVSQFKFEGTLRLDCYVTGVVGSQTGTLIVSETAELQANIFVATAIVDGLVRGDIRATERVELGNNACVIGNIETPALTIQPGAMFEGQCHFLSSPRPTDSEQSSVDDSTGSKGSSRRTRSKPDQQEETEALALAAGR